MMSLAGAVGGKPLTKKIDKGDDPNELGDQHYQTDMNSFRSTQHTFMNKLSQNNKSQMKNSVADNVSAGMFSFQTS